MGAENGKVKSELIEVQVMRCKFRAYSGYNARPMIQTAGNRARKGSDLRIMEQRSASCGEGADMGEKR